MVTEQQVDAVLTKFYLDFTADIDSFKKMYRSMAEAENSYGEEAHATGSVYGMELAERAFLKAYKEACRTKKK